MILLPASYLTLLLLATSTPPIVKHKESTSPSSPIVKLVDDYREQYHELIDVAGPGTSPTRTTLNYTDSIHFSYVPPTSSQPQKQHDDHSSALSTSFFNKNIFDQIASTHNHTKLAALYLPGIDGSGYSAQKQFSSLAQAFELWRMTIDVNDRSYLTEIVDAITRFIDNVTTTNSNRQILLIGESFGGGLAPIVALQRKNAVKGLVLVSPFMTFNATQWTKVVPFMTAALPHRTSNNDEKQPISKRRKNWFPTPYSVAGGLTVGLSDKKQFRRIFDQVRQLIPGGQTTMQDFWVALKRGFGLWEEALPADTLQYRVKQWLSVVSSLLTTSRLKRLDHVKTLVISGSGDTVAPQTSQETTKLLDAIPHCSKLEFDSLGHFLLQENINLTRIILESEIFSKPYDPIVDWKPPSKDIVQLIRNDWMQPLRRLYSPVFFSTDKHENRHKGLGHVAIPDDGPVLFVANHQLGGLDMQLYVSQLIEDRDVYLRGLGHPAIFQGEQKKGPFTDLALPFPVTEEEGGGEGITRKQGFYEKFGCVEVSPRNFYRLMQTGQRALLLPGGIREAFHGKDEAYKLFWPTKVDFVRTAAKFNATIIPISAVGAADSANIVLDASDVLKLPFGLGKRFSESIWVLHRGRYDDKENEVLNPPLIVPKPIPARHYFLFGKAISTDTVNHNDRDACNEVYKDAQREVKRGLHDLLKARKKDPFGNSETRMLYEQLTGRPAPTFGMDEFTNN